MRKLLFTLAAIDTVLNMLVVLIFMQPEVVVLYGISGHAFVYGSKYIYLLMAALPAAFAGIMLLIQQHSQVRSNDNADEGNDMEQSDDVDDISATTVAIDEMLKSTEHGNNWTMVLTWFFAVISWVLTGIALNDIEYVGVIIPSIIVIMLSAFTIFFSSFYRDDAPRSVVGIRLRWLDDNEQLRHRTNHLSFYCGVMGGLVGVCLAAWSLVVSSVLPNCLAIVILLVMAALIPIVYSYSIYRKNKADKEHKDSEQP